MSPFRKAFERYITRGDNPEYKFLSEKLPNNTYKYVQSEWESWCAALEWNDVSRFLDES